MAIVPATSEMIARAAEAVRAGQLVAFPTETVYGLGADATNDRAVAAIYEAKGRPSFNPLIVHTVSLSMMQQIAIFDSVSRKLMTAFWPGPLTLVMRRAPDCMVSYLATAGLDTIALRSPKNTVAWEFLKQVARPVVAPSANRSGHVSATSAQHVHDDLASHVAMILDGGDTSLGVESTVLDIAGARPVLLRPGSVTREAIEAVVGAIDVGAGDAAKPSAPGQLASHYAPRAGVRLDAVDVRAGEALLAFGAQVPAHSGAMINLSATGDLVEAAARLFAALRALDASGAATIAVMPIPEIGLGVAINDRLRRAAAPRG